MSTRALLLLLSGLGGALCGVAALAGFALYVNHFSETGRDLGGLVVALSWVAALLAACGVVTFVVTLVHAAVDGVTRDA